MYKLGVIIFFHYLKRQYRLFNNYSPKANYSTIFTKSEENNCFSIIAQVIIRAIAFSFILLVFFFTNMKKLRGGHFENQCFSIIITSREEFARGDYSEI